MIDTIVVIVLFHISLLISDFCMVKYGRNWITMYIPFIVVVFCGLIIWYVIKQTMIKMNIGHYEKNTNL